MTFLPLPAAAEVLQSLATALALGLLVGLQREWVRSQVAGIRTFALLTLFGALAGLIGLAFGGWVIAAGFLAFAAMVILGNLGERKQQDPDIGLTTEMAMLVMFAVGIIIMLGHRLEAMVVAGVVMVLLHSKKRLHAMVYRIGEDDLREIARLVLVGLVILPVLPNRAMGYLNVLNPFAIGLMIVLVVGISLTGYLAGKFLGCDRGALLAGLLGGLVSSTATTASVARRSQGRGAGSLELAAVCVIASAFVFLRVLAEIRVAAPAHWTALLPPLLAMTVWFVLVAALTYLRARRHGGVGVEEAPPSELKGAVVFGLLYALVLVGLAAARQHLGPVGLYVTAALSGLTDMDAITLSTAQLVSTSHLEAATAWRLILVGGLANLLFKMGLIAMLGAPALRRAALPALAAAMAGGGAILAFWP
jgi:uncharacterized membrane protein (DUF4010 family)